MLPASTLTNMGFFGDGRAYEYLLTRMYADDLSEMRDLASMMQEELGKVIPSFVKRASNKYGMAMQGYYRKVRSDMEKIAQSHGGASGGEGVRLVDYDRDAEGRVIAAALYPCLNRPMDEIRAIVDGMPPQERESVIKTYINDRENRRHKPGRAFEHAYYTFDVCANFGCYRDMHRHRMLTQQRQPLNPHHGYKLPQELVEAGFDGPFKEVMDSSKDAYEEIAKDLPREAQYVVPLAYNIRWYMHFNIREAYHMLELRSGMQGHPDYRKIAQDMFREIEKVHPVLASGMRFMDMGQHKLERLEAEKRIDRKMQEIDERYAR